MVILFRVLVTLHGVLNSPYTGNSQSGGYSLFLTVYYQWIYAKVYATKTRISIGGVQDRDTLIEQSANYSNRTFTGNM